MLLLVLALAATDVDPARVDGGGAVAREARHADIEAAPWWHYFVVPAGLSLVSSVLLAVPAALASPFATLLSLTVLVAAAPIVAAVGVSRLDDRESAGPVVGVIVGDVIGAVVGSIAGFVVFQQLFAGRIRNTCDNCIIGEESAVALANILVGSWIGRALGSGVGGVIGQAFPEPATPHVY